MQLQNRWHIICLVRILVKVERAAIPFHSSSISFLSLERSQSSSTLLFNGFSVIRIRLIDLFGSDERFINAYRFIAKIMPEIYRMYCPDQFNDRHEVCLCIQAKNSFVFSRFLSFCLSVYLSICLMKISESYRLNGTKTWNRTALQSRFQIKETFPDEGWTRIICLRDNPLFRFAVIC